MWALHRRASERRCTGGAAPVLVEGWRGDAQTARLLQGCQVEGVEETAARAAGLLLGACAAAVEATDAVVVAARYAAGSRW